MLLDTTTRKHKCPLLSARRGTASDEDEDTRWQPSFPDTSVVLL